MRSQPSGGLQGHVKTNGLAMIGWSLKPRAAQQGVEADEAEHNGASQLNSSVLLLSGWTTKGKPSRVWTRRDGSGYPTHRLRRPHRLDGCHRLRRARHLGEQVHLVAWFRGRP
jgi:hypothetical protein